jgi:energy-coupling factor transport system permease protein
VSAAPGAALLVAAVVAALLASHTASVAAIAALLLAVALRAPARRRWPYLVGALAAGTSVLVVSPFVQSTGSHPLWTGPVLPVLGPLDVTTEELSGAAVQALRLGACALAFAAYALLLDHDRLVQAARITRRSALAVALATRLVPTLERDAAGFVEALRGRGVQVSGVAGRARLLSPLVAGSLERGLNLAEAMEARGYGRRGATTAWRPRWGILDVAAIGLGLALVVGASTWL